MGGGGKGGGSQTVKQELDPTIKPYVKYALEQGKEQYGKRTGAGNPPVYGGDLVAGFTPDTADYFAGVRGLTEGTEQTAEAQKMLQGAAGQYMGQPSYQGAQFDPNRLTQANIQEYMNPYQEDVIAKQMASMQRQQGEEAAGLRTRQAGAGALGGSRAGVESAIRAREGNELQAQTEAQLRQAGYDAATATAMAQQAASADAAKATEASRQFAEAAAQDKANYGLSAAAGLAGLGQQERDLETQRLEGLRGIGAQQMALTQTELDAAYKQYLEGRDWNKNELADYAAIAYGAPHGSTQTTTQSGGGAGSMIGSALYGIGSLSQGSILGGLLGG